MKNFWLTVLAVGMLLGLGSTTTAQTLQTLDTSADMIALNSEYASIQILDGSEGRVFLSTGAIREYLKNSVNVNAYATLDVEVLDSARIVLVNQDRSYMVDVVFDTTHPDYLACVSFWVNGKLLRTNMRFSALNW